MFTDNVVGYFLFLANLRGEAMEMANIDVNVSHPRWGLTSKSNFLQGLAFRQHSRLSTYNHYAMETIVDKT